MLCVVVCAFFLLNLTIAVMLQKYEELGKTTGASKHKSELLEFGYAAGLPKELIEFLITQDNLTISKKQRGNKQEEQTDEYSFFKSFCYDVVKVPNERYYDLKVTRLSFKLVTLPAFNTFILVIIFCNTVVLGLDRYPILPEEEQALQIINYAFAGIFTLEVILKLIGLGVRRFLDDRFNTFDFIVVIISLVCEL